MAFLIDDLLLAPINLPIAGFNWILRQIQTMADEELLNDQVWKERLIELQMMLEVRARKEEIALQYAADQGEEGEGIGIYTGYGE